MKLKKKKNNSPVPSLPAKMEILLILAKTSSKAVIKLFLWFTLSHEN